MPKQMKPFGTWKSPISPTTMRGDYRLHDVKWDTNGNTLVWHERRAGGSALVVQEGNHNPRDLLRDEVIGGGVLYGGGGFTVGHDMVYFVGRGGRIYRVAVGGGIPDPITPEFGAAASPTLSPDGKWVLYVHSYEGRDALAAVPSDGSGYPRKLLDNADFIMHPAWHPYGDRIACITWNHPHMPWNASTLHLLYLGADPEPNVIGRQVITGADNDEAIFGAAFSPDSGYLAYASDRSGWWQIYLYDLDLAEHIQLTHDKAEYAVPAWLQDMRTFAWAKDSRAIFALHNQDSRYTLRKIMVEAGDAETISALDRYTHLEQIAVSPVNGGIAVIAGASNIPDRVVTCSTNDNHESVQVRTYSSTESIPAEYLASVQDITWEADDGSVIHGLYYPPTNPAFESGGVPPLIMYIHSGPTRQRFARYFPQPHFFASRGFAVLEPNYRGSTGYGKAFKDKLHGNWGVVDVDDCMRGAKHLVSRGLADADKVVVMGESSGGFSVLQSLILYPGFYRAGVCQAPVTDQFALAMETHKFEQHYNDSLVGPLPQAAQTYRDRSPALHAEKIKDPVAIFHGTRDSVVSHTQSEAVAGVLRRRGVPHVFKLYEGEGHSFRNPDNIADYYDTVMKFLLQYVIYV